MTDPTPAPRENERGQSPHGLCWNRILEHYDVAPKSVGGGDSIDGPSIIAETLDEATAPLASALLRAAEGDVGPSYWDEVEELLAHHPPAQTKSNRT